LTSETFAVKPTAESHFSWMRTRMSLERTLMSWVRTATALIGFGFTIVQFFERLGEMSEVPAVRPQMPRYLGLGLILAGILALVVSTWQYEKTVRYLWSEEFLPLAGFGKRTPKRTPLLIVAVFLAFIGVCAFLAVYLRLL
jgi:putative membrane protein